LQLDQQLAAARTDAAAAHTTIASLQRDLASARDNAAATDRELRAARADVEAGVARQSGAVCD
jgi:hypothetical protein